MVQGAWPFLVCATVVLLKGEEDRKLQEEHTLKKKQRVGVEVGDGQRVNIR